MRVLGQRVSRERALQLGFERGKSDSELSFRLEGNGRNYYLKLTLDDDEIVSVDRYSIRHPTGCGRSSHGRQSISRFPQGISQGISELVGRLIEESRPFVEARQARLKDNENYFADTAAFRVLRNCIGDVTCTRDEDDRIIGVEIDAWRKTVTIPPEIGLLSELRHLHCKCDELICIPPQIGELSRLQHLYIDSAKLSHLPDELGQLQTLEKLSVCNNHFSEFPEVVTRLANLKVLLSGACHLKTLPRTIGNLKNLMGLALYSNELTSVPEEIGELTELEWLDLSYNQLTSIPHQLGNLKKLKSLKIKFNRLRSISSAIAKLPLLTPYEFVKDDTCLVE